MGGPGSGFYYRYSRQATIEEFPRLFIWYLQREGMLKPGTSSIVSWTCGNEPSGSVRVTASPNWLTLNYTATDFYGDSEEIEQKVFIEHMPLHFGGSRPWFACPKCHQRAGALIGSGKHFVCRECTGLIYGCQQESHSDRAARRVRKIQKRLGNPEWQNALEPWFPRPKGMHWTTYNRIVAQADKPLRTIQAQMAGWGMLDLVKYF